MSEIKLFGVVGAGQMGNGIAQVAAQSGLAVVLRDLDSSLVKNAVDTIAKMMRSPA